MNSLSKEVKRAMIFCPACLLVIVVIIVISKNVTGLLLFATGLQVIAWFVLGMAVHEDRKKTL